MCKTLSGIELDDYIYDFVIYHTHTHTDDIVAFSGILLGIVYPMKPKLVAVRETVRKLAMTKHEKLHRL